MKGQADPELNEILLHLLTSPDRRHLSESDTSRNFPIARDAGPAQSSVTLTGSQPSV